MKSSCKTENECNFFYFLKNNFTSIFFVESLQPGNYSCDCWQLINSHETFSQYSSLISLKSKVSALNYYNKYSTLLCIWGWVMKNKSFLKVVSANAYMKDVRLNKQQAIFILDYFMFVFFFVLLRPVLLGRLI